MKMMRFSTKCVCVYVLVYVDLICVRKMHLLPTIYMLHEKTRWSLARFVKLYRLQIVTMMWFESHMLAHSFLWRVPHLIHFLALLVEFFVCVMCSNDASTSHITSSTRQIADPWARVAAIKNCNCEEKWCLTSATIHIIQLNIINRMHERHHWALVMRIGLIVCHNPLGRRTRAYDNEIKINSIWCQMEGNAAPSMREKKPWEYGAHATARGLCTTGDTRKSPRELFDSGVIVLLVSK